MRTQSTKLKNPIQRPANQKLLVFWGFFFFFSVMSGVGWFVKMALRGTWGLFWLASKAFMSSSFFIFFIPSFFFFFISFPWTLFLGFPWIYFFKSLHTIAHQSMQNCLQNGPLKLLEWTARLFKRRPWWLNVFFFLKEKMPCKLPLFRWGFLSLVSSYWCTILWIFLEILQFFNF